MRTIFDYLISLREEYNIGWSVNEFGILTVIQYYQESINGRRIYGLKKKKLVQIPLDTALSNPKEIAKRINRSLIEYNNKTQL